MTIELINTGSELMLGRVLNTHQQWICRTLADEGYVVRRQVAVSDAASDIESAVREGLERADLVLTTGGLGPTCDDRTRDLIAALLGRRLLHAPEVEVQIREYFESRGRPVPGRTKVEALVPEGATILPNRNGTAPGLVLTVDPNPSRQSQQASTLIMLPGPPRELRPMMRDQVLPLIRQRYPRNEPFVCRTLRTTGIGESFLEERLTGPLKHLTDAGMDLGFCARVGEVDVRFVAEGADAAARVAEAESIVRLQAGDYIFGEQEDTLELAVVREMSARGLRLAIAESCTGGAILHRLTNIPGASRVLSAGYVTYSNQSKIEALGVRPESLAEHGAVSETVVREMAEGARSAGRADVAVATTGIAGPDGGTPEKPVGTVWIGLSGPEGTSAIREFNRFDRETFKFTTGQQVLSMLLKSVRRARSVEQGG